MSSEPEKSPTPPGVSIGPGQYLIFYADDDGTQASIAFEAYFTISAERTSMMKIGLPCRTNGSYRRVMRFAARSLEVPMTTRSGFMKSSIAAPSLRNSGLDTTSNSIATPRTRNGVDAKTPTGPLIPVGDAVNWTYEVSNVGTLELTDLDVTDSEGETIAAFYTRTAGAPIRAVQALFEAGDAEVHMRIACPTLIYPCEFLSFSTSRSTLDLAGHKAITALEGKEDKNLPQYATARSLKNLAMVDHIRQRLKLTSLQYQKLDDLVAAIGLPKEKLCTHCWDGTSYF